MANAWAELSRLGHPRGSRALMALACLSLLTLGCSKAPSGDRSANLVEAAVGASPDGLSFEGDIGRFNPAGDTLAVVEGRDLILTSLVDGKRSVTGIDQDVTDLVYADDDGLWLIGHEAASYWQNGQRQCAANGLGDHPSLVGVSDRKIELVTEAYVDGSGVLGELIGIGTDCSIERSPKIQGVATAKISLDHERSLIAHAATLDAGPSRRLGPAIDVRENDEVVAEIEAFDRQMDISRISAIAAGDNRLIALGTGTKGSYWELWAIDQPRLISTGQAAQPSARLLPVARTDHVILGRNLIDLVSGQGQPLLSTGIILDVTDDQAWWLIADEGRLSLRSAVNLNN